MQVAGSVRRALSGVLEDRSPVQSLQRTTRLVLLGAGAAVAALAGALAAIPTGSIPVGAFPWKYLYEVDPGVGSVVLGLVIGSATLTVLSARLFSETPRSGLRVGAMAGAAGFALEAVNSFLSPSSSGSLDFSGKIEAFPQAGLVVWWGLMVVAGSAVARSSVRPVRRPWGRPGPHRIRLRRPRALRGEPTRAHPWRGPVPSLRPSGGSD